MNTRGLFTKSKQKSLALVSVFPEHLLSLMCRHLLTFSFFPTGHDILLTSNSVFQYRKIHAVRQERDGTLHGNQVLPKRGNNA